ncbi:DUF885 domain-containing protein [Nonlabens agnitus]|uniref:DUF885 domain-containing protein n=1 Tax=Nonlabens agnitus TaxID=870484 RepID=A0A2S9WTY1_9FLAO|nr:DUF885 domain-containing protein [Nonlabens agnitus]PRP66934.1 hypothetical protein BST86_07395 [Nonlabens agnitus]
MRKTVFLAIILILGSCKNDNDSHAFAKAEQLKISQEFNNWLEAQFQKDLARDPEMQTQMGIKTDYGKWTDISSARDLEDKELAESRLKYLTKEVEEQALEGQDLLSYRLYKREQEQKIADYDYRLYSYPVNQMHGMQSEVPAFLINMHQIASESDALAYIERLKGIQPLFEELTNNLSLRETNGILLPRFVFEKVLKDSRNVITGAPFSDFGDKSTLAADFDEKINKLDLDAQRKEELKAMADEALLQYVMPAYENLITFLTDQQQRATGEDGAWKFPKGAEFYQHALNRTTTTSMTADEIHELGLKEVERIHNEMREIMKQVKFEGTLQDFFKFMRDDDQFYYPDTDAGKKRYLSEAKTKINAMKAKLPELFHTLPEADIIVKAVEPFRESSAGKAFYQQPATDGSRPGTYYANLYDMKAMPTYQMDALAYHEGIPGHHMQIAIAQELDSIPEFRKHSFYTAYVEGWGLYSELIPKEIGFYKDPYSDFGRLAMELWRACRLVVDTGIHSKKWSREEGIEYYMANTPNAESDAIKMVERHIIMPSQATAYKVGMNKILQLRAKALDALGEDFDIKDFHDVVLTNGSLPLSILEELVDEYIENTK